MLILSAKEHRDIMVHILDKDYPDIALQIRDKIVSVLPSRQLNDLSKMEFIVNQFKEFFDVSPTQNWLNEIGKASITEKREMLAVVVALVYCPARVLALDNKLRNGVLAELCRLTGCPKGIMSPSLSNAVVAYKAYKDFRDRVDKFYTYLVDSGIFSDQHVF